MAQPKMFRVIVLGGMALVEGAGGCGGTGGRRKRHLQRETPRAYRMAFPQRRPRPLTWWSG